MVTASSNNTLFAKPGQAEIWPGEFAGARLSGGNWVPLKRSDARSPASVCLLVTH